MSRPAPEPAPTPAALHRLVLAPLRRRARPVVAAAGLGLLLLGLLPLQPSLAGGSTAEAATLRPFAASSPFNQPVPASVALDPGSAAMVARATRTGQLNANLVAYGVPVYTASAGTQRYPVTCRLTPVWGPCPFAGLSVRIPAAARPSPGTDGALVVVDPASGVSAEFWQATPGRTRWSTSWGAVHPLTGSGWGGGSTGAGASRLAGVVRVSEIEAGRIDHALVLQSDNVCVDVVRAPATKTDGTSTRADCIPEGARLQLDPKVDVAHLPHSTPGERAVARALQRYGGYVIDRGGAPLSVSFEEARDATGTNPGAVYRAAGLAWDYYGMPHVPWQRLRVLQRWDGTRSPSTAVRTGPAGMRVRPAAAPRDAGPGVDAAPAIPG